MYFYRIYILLLVCLMVCQIHAQTKWGLPASATGRAGSAILDAVAADDDSIRYQFIQNQLAEVFRNEFSLFDHLNILKETYQALGNFEIIGIKKRGPYKAALILKSLQSDKKLIIRYQIQAGEPHLITSLTIEPASSIPIFADINQLKSYLEQQTAAGIFSGVVLIVRDNERIFEKAYGLASKRYKVQNEIQTRFNIGSINKIFTKIAVFQLIALGKMEMDQTIGSLLSDLNIEWAQDVTIRHLLEHRSGLGHYWNELYRQRFSQMRTVSDFVDLVKNQSLGFKPGTDQKYSNSGYVLLGAAIERVSGMDYYEYIRRHIYQPAGMTASDHFELDLPITNIATGYTNQNPDGTEGSEYRRNNTYFALKGSPAGGGYSTVNDLYRFDRALRDGIFFSEKDSEHTRYFRELSGLGIAGGGPGVSAILESDWAKGHTVIVLSNYDPPFAENLGLAIMTSLRKKKQK